MWIIASGVAEGITIDFVTSDHHIGHKNIIKYCDRPYDDVPHMDSMLMSNWNSVVDVDSVVLVLGDIAMGRIEISLEKWKKFNGVKLLVPGNHDYVSKAYSEPKREQTREMYEKAGFVILEETIHLEDNKGRKIVASHYPYKGDSQEKERHAKLRPIDEGLPLIHGHTHSPHVLSENNRQFHVGIDAHDYMPVPMSEITNWMNNN